MNDLEPGKVFLNEAQNTNHKINTLEYVTTMNFHLSKDDINKEATNRVREDICHTRI